MGGGGVFLCIKKHLQCLEESSLDAEAELIWVKLIPSNQRPIFVCAFYRPPSTDLQPIEQLRVSLNKLMDQSRTLPNILLTGDFNFPGLTWSDGYGQISLPTYGSSLNNLFLDTLADARLKQYVYQPTRQNNILD